MSFFSELKEIIYNFTHEVKDNNSLDLDISDDNFVAIANASGMSQKAIAELLGTRNGINKPSVTKSKLFDEKQKVEQKDIEEKKHSINKEENGRDR